MIDDVLTCYPGRIVSFDPSTQTASVMIASEKFTSDLRADYQKVSRKPIDNIPVSFIQGDEYCITHEVKAGKACLIWFTHRGYDHWMDGKMEAGTYSNGYPKGHLMRTFSISDAFVTVGFTPSSEPIPDFNNVGIEIRSRGNRAQRIAIHGSTMELLNPSGDINTVCANFNVTADKSLFTCPDVTITGALKVGKTGGFGEPVTAPNFIIGVSGKAVMAVKAAASNLVDLIKFYTGHSHNYTDDGNPMVTNTPNDGT